MVSKTTKYEQKQLKRFIKRENERRELLNRLLHQDPLYDMYEPWIRALTNLAYEFTLVDKDIVYTYLKNHKKESNDAC